jgi:ATP-dependent DNA helicase RecG
MSLYFDTPIQYLKGVGPKLGDLLKKKGVRTLGDLLQNYPRSYEDRRANRSISTLEPNETVSIKAEILNVSSYSLGKSKKKIYDISIRDSSGIIHCKYFRVPYRGYFERFQPRMSVRVIGKVTNYRGKIEFHHPDIQEINQNEEIKDELVPIYSETDGLTSTRWRKILSGATSSLKDGEIKGIDEKLPSWLVKNYNLPSLEETFLKIHQPPKGSGEEFLKYNSPFHQRIIFEEFFWLEMLMAAKKQGVQKDKAPVFLKKINLAEQLQKSLAFQMTQAQKRAFSEIVNDLNRSFPMHRLVQGDVGSGKTLVALMSALVAIENNFQAALMVPTEILAQQHFIAATKYFEPLGLKVGFLSGQLKAKEKLEVYDKIASGFYNLVVGTHALIQDKVKFAKLGLVIVDEQHRFGVEQRKKLKNKGLSPHFLLMTATPIPRSLAMTVYGDLDVSIIDEMPKGRQPIVTRMTYQSKRNKIIGFVNDQLIKGRQAYIVFPLVEESDKIDLSNAIDEFEKIKKELPDFKIGLIHGKMKSSEKDEVMEKFRDKQFDVLVATTVIEVGVDVANANIIWIDHAERFGLSQLHQLRGRVGRGEHKSYCILSLGYAVSEESRARIQLMEQTSDGFKIAEADLEIRGPGEFLGSKQSGLPGFKMANLVRDLPLLKKAREAAFEVIKRDPELAKMENKFLREEILNNKDMIG